MYLLKPLTYLTTYGLGIWFKRVRRGRLVSLPSRRVGYRVVMRGVGGISDDPDSPLMIRFFLLSQDHALLVVEVPQAQRETFNAKRTSLLHLLLVPRPRGFAYLTHTRAHSHASRSVVPVMNRGSTARAGFQVIVVILWSIE